MENSTATLPSVGLGGKITGILNKYPVILQLLRFGAIGVFNTTVDVLVLNYMAVQFGVQKGGSLGWVNLPGFVLAVFQSYFWNKYWAFGENDGSKILKNFLRLVAVGITGLAVYVFVIIGAHNSARPVYFLGILAVFAAAQLVLWYGFGFFKAKIASVSRDYVSFFVVSAIGFLINSLVLYLATTKLALSGNVGDNLNIGKIIATCASLVWNFIGYKIFVFKK